MDAMDIFGALLGRKSGSGGAGGNVLKDILGGRKQAPAQSGSRHHPRAQRPTSIGESARELEEMLNVSNDHHQHRRSSSPQQAPRQQAPAPSQPAPRWTPQEHEAMNEQSKILIRAMVAAAKSDGQITQDEQDKVIKQLDHVSQEEANFLREEFAKPLDVRGFTWSVPLGMEEQVYTLSLIAIDLDEQKEANYLADLAQGLRLAPARCNEIHQRYGAPMIFQT